MVSLLKLLLLLLVIVVFISALASWAILANTNVWCLGDDGNECFSLFKALPVACLVI